MINIGIIEDHLVLVDALSLMMRNVEDLSLVGTAGTLAAARDLLKNTTPDVILLDVGLPDGDGLCLVSEIKACNPNTQVVVLTSLSDETTLMRAIDEGVSGFVSKSSSLADLIQTIRKAAEGEIIMPSSLLFGLVKRFSRNETAYHYSEQGWEPLTTRERQVLGLLSQGKSGNEIAEELQITPMTVRTHIRNLMAKLGVHSRLEAVSFGIRNGLINPPA